MGYRHGGNGEGRIEIKQVDLRVVVRVHPAHMPDDPEDLPKDLPMALTMGINDWFEKRPHARLISVVPIVWQGYTVALHAWYAVEETAAAKVVDFKDHRLTEDDFVQFEREVKAAGGQLTARFGKTKSPKGTAYAYLSQIRLTYPPARQNELESLWRAYGFEPAKPAG